MTSRTLAADLAARIKAEGPLSVGTVMAEAARAYYAGRDPFGVGGDFITAPEISQMFGELIGLWAAVVWQSMGAPERVVLAELGPGRGTLMADLLRAARQVPPFRAALDIWLVETSPKLRRVQRKTLTGEPIHWAARVEDLPPGPLLVVANELFDALAIEQYVKQGGAWRRRLVDLDANGGFTFVVGSADLPELAPSVTDAAEGAIAEICPEGRRLAGVLGRRLAAAPGAALIIDYGYSRSAAGDSLQALKQHRFHPVLDDLGDADITAHVDFEALALAAMPARSWGPVGQGEFLRRLGIEARAAKLTEGKRPEVVADLVGRMHRLIDPGEMGTLFKVMALAHPALLPPPGLES